MRILDISRKSHQFSWMFWLFYYGHTETSWDVLIFTSWNIGRERGSHSIYLLINFLPVLGRSTTHVFFKFWYQLRSAVWGWKKREREQKKRERNVCCLLFVGIKMLLLYMTTLSLLTCKRTILYLKNLFSPSHQLLRKPRSNIDSLV